MKTTSLFLALALVLAATQASLAGGNTSIVSLDKVTSIKIEDQKITITGSGKLRRRILSDKEHGDATVFGQPAQMIYARVIDCTFEVVPYHIGSDIRGVPGTGPDNITPEQKAQSLKWWEGTLAQAREIKVGDAITIGYQREKMTISSVYITHIIGSGSLGVTQKRAK